MIIEHSSFFFILLRVPFSRLWIIIKNISINIILLHDMNKISFIHFIKISKFHGTDVYVMKIAILFGKCDISMILYFVI